MQQPGPGHGRPERTAAHNLFFALWPGDDVRAQIGDRAQALCAGRGAHGRPVKPARYHLTLQFLGEFDEVPQALLDDAIHVAAHLETSAFALTLDQAGSFGHVWWLGCTRCPAALHALRRGLDTVPARAPDRFTPHVTVLRGAGAQLPTMPITPVAWPVREFVLIDSEVASPTPYRVVGRWPLHGT